MWREELQSVAGTVASRAFLIAASCCSFMYLRVIWDDDQFFSAENLSIAFLCFWSFSFGNYSQALLTVILEHGGQSVAFFELFVQWVLIRYLILGIFGRDQFQMQLLRLNDFNVLVWSRYVSYLISILPNLFQGPASNLLWSLHEFLQLPALLLIGRILNRIGGIWLYHLLLFDSSWVKYLFNPLLNFYFTNSNLKIKQSYSNN